MTQLIEKTKFCMYAKTKPHMTLRDACYLTVSSGVPDVLGLPGLLMKDNP